MSNVVSMKKLLESGIHIGHNTRKWNPKMKPYIYTARNSVYIIDLNKTIECVNVAYKKLRKIAANKGKVLFVGTKKQAQQIVEEEALRAGAFYVNHRWLGGILTNFKTIQKRIQRLVAIEQMEESKKIEVYPKKEQAQIRKEKLRLESFLGGIKEMKKLPDAIFIIDPIEEHIAVAEAKKLGIPVFALCDTNSNPEEITYPIPSNDDAMKSIKLMTALMADAIVDANNGLLSVANTSEEEAEDISMNEVIANVDEVHAENERRRKEKLEERKKMFNRRFDSRNRDNNHRSRRHNNEKKEVKEQKTEETVKEGE